MPIIQQYDVVVARDYVIVSIELCPELENDEFIIVCNFGGRSISGSEVIEGGLRRRPSHRKQNKARSEQGKVKN